MTFKYATSTTATGENRSEWGNYNGHLEEVILNAWEPKAGEMVKKIVAAYEYDSRGWLRAEWNPQIEPGLKTTYGYDGSGHVAAITPPGQQPWLFTYGTTEGDPTLGRLISVTRPSAATGFGNGEAPKNTAVPTLSSTKPVVGTELSVSSNGTWSSSPLTYSYQWEDCNSSGGECVVIPGAVNKSYDPGTRDEGHTLVAQVISANATATVTAATVASSPVAAGTPTSKVPAPPNPGSNAVWTIDYGVPVSGAGAPYQMGAKEVEAWGQHDDPAEATAFFPPDEPEGWPAENYKRASIYYVDGHDRQVNGASPGGAILTKEYNETNDVVRSLTADNRQSALDAGSKSAEVAQQLDTESVYGDEGTELLSVLGPQHNIELASGSQVQARAITHYFYDEGAPTEGGPYRLETKVTAAALVEGKEEEVQTSVNSYSGQGGLGWKLRQPTSTTADPSGINLSHTTAFQPETGAVTETRTPAGMAPGEEPAYSFGFEFEDSYGTEKMEEPQAVAVSPSGYVYVIDRGYIEKYNQEGKYVEILGPYSGEENGALSDASGLTIDSEGHIFVADTDHDRIVEYNAEGQYMRAIGSKAELDKPEAVAVNSLGDVSVADTKGNQIDEYASHENSRGEREYTLTSTIKSAGEKDFDKPEGIAVNAENDVFISDTGNGRIVELSPTGALLRTWGKKGTKEGEMADPAGLSVGPGGNVFVADRGSTAHVDEFTPTGTLMRTIGEKGSKEDAKKAPRRIRGRLRARMDHKHRRRGHGRVEPRRPQPRRHRRKPARHADDLLHGGAQRVPLELRRTPGMGEPRLPDPASRAARRQPPQAADHDLHLQPVG